MWNLKIQKKNQNKTKKKGQTHRHKEQMDGSRRGVRRIGKGSQKAQISGRKISHRDGMYSMVTTANNTVLHT